MKKDYYVVSVVGITVQPHTDCLVNANNRLVRFENEEEAQKAMKTLEDFGIESKLYVQK